MIHHDPEPCISPGSLNRVPASVGVGLRAGMSSLSGDPTWHVSSSSGEAGLRTSIPRLLYFTLLYLRYLSAESGHLSICPLTRTSSPDSPESLFNYSSRQTASRRQHSYLFFNDSFYLQTAGRFPELDNPILICLL